MAAPLFLALSAGCSDIAAKEEVVSSSTRSYSPGEEALYQDRFRALAESGSVGARGAAYSPLETVPGSLDGSVMAKRSEPTLSSSALARARDYAAERNSSALIVWKDGAIEFEDYFGDFTSDSDIISKSLAKPLTALLIGRAIELGYIESLDQAVADFIIEWRDDPVRSRITIRHLLSMSSGLLPQALGGGPEDLLYRAYLHPRHAEIIINDYPVSDEPGSVYEYSNANAELIAPIIERATGMRYAAFVSGALLEPIGASGGTVWVNRAGGTAHSGCCMMLPARSWLRMAILVLQGGVWNGERLLPDGYISEMRNPSPENAHYGLGLWLAGPYLRYRGFANPRIKEGRIFHSEPYLDKDLVLFDGNSNQVVYIVPSQTMVILRTGSKPSPAREWDNSFLPNLLIRDALRLPGAVVPKVQTE